MTPPEEDGRDEKDNGRECKREPETHVLRGSETAIKSEEGVYLFRIDHANLPDQRADVCKEIVILDRRGWVE